MDTAFKNELIKVEKLDNRVAIVTLNNPPMNLNSIASMAELAEDFRILRRDPEVGVVILTGAGTKAFNVGTDLHEMADMYGLYKEKKFYNELLMMDNIEFIPKPTICAIEGYCMGGGLELAMCCDFRIASETAKFSQPEITLGVFPGAGGLFRLPRIVGMGKALEMMYTGLPIDAQEAYAYRLVNRVVPVGETVNEAMKLAQRIASFSPQALAAIKEGARKMWQKETKDNFYTNLDYIEPVFESDNGQEGIQAFLDKRQANFTF